MNKVSTRENGRVNRLVVDGLSVERRRRRGREKKWAEVGGRRVGGGGG